MRLDEDEGSMLGSTFGHDILVHALASGNNDAVADPVGVAIRTRPAILHVAPPILLSIPGNANGSGAVRHSVLEGVNVASLMLARQPLVIILAVVLDVLLDHLAESLADLDDDIVAALSPHGRSREVGVAACTIPVAFRGLGVNGANDAMFLRHAQHDVACHGHVIANLDATAWADLVLPLTWHHLRVDAGNLHTGLHAHGIVLIGDGTANGHPKASTGVIWPLRCRRTAVLVESQRYRGLLAHLTWAHQRVLLLDAKPRVELLVLRHVCGTLCTSVADRRLVVPGIPAISHDQDVGWPTERIVEDSTRLQKHLRVVPIRLLGAAAVVVPDPEI
mmetsp:Transcript_56398/g.101369  ORF Transcript_56398/g.101369 Transcript_56398/m.101369 type:complete len:334 (-) Transcript_56398:242-1243(-)